jgi:hypothetical protein
MFNLVVLTCTVAGHDPVGHHWIFIAAKAPASDGPTSFKDEVESTIHLYNIEINKS